MSGEGQQEDVLAFLADPATHGLDEPVQRIDTHGAAVFLAGPDVYKLKRAVRLPYLDFSTLAARQKACAREIEVNRPLAPELYLGVLPITRAADGLHLDGKGAIVDWVVHLRRFDERATLDRLAERRALQPALIDELARAVEASHRQARTMREGTATAALGHVLDETVAEMQAARDLLPTAGLERLAAGLKTAFAVQEGLLRAREAAGMVRRCHGDLHLRNIASIDGKPVLFDALEFDEAMATTDILYDFAFLLMDLEVRGLRAESNRLFNRYFWLTGHPRDFAAGCALLPLFLGLRAAIRAKIEVTQARSHHKDAAHLGAARDYLAAALDFLKAAPPCLLAVGGLSGSGKSTLAAALAPALQPAPGALHLRSDIERKRLFAVDPLQRLPARAYTGDVSDEVHARLYELAGRALAAGQSVVVDAVHQDEPRRREVEAIAGRQNVPFKGFWLEADPALLRERVSRRQGDASDATAAVVDAQLERPLGTMSWKKLDAAASPAAILVEASALLPAASRRNESRRS